jgi:phospholipase A-2-activating protein
MCAEHQKQVRALVALPPSPAVPTGGFATGSLDTAVRVYQYDEKTRSVTLLKTLSGHMAGVISLCLTPTGELVSGGWEGQVRIWDLATGACLQVLEGHENGTCVTCLPTGEIIAGSSGRKNEYDQPVDFKIRIWARTTGNTDKAAYSLKKMFQDHTLGVRDLAVLPGTGFVSASNDGTVRVRTPDGSVISTFTNPLSSDGHPVFCYSVHVTLPAGLIVTCSDDHIARIYTADGLLDEIPLPGTPWKAASLPNGDIVLACDQAGSSRRGHVYIYTAEPGKRCSETEMIRFAKDIEPPSTKPPAEDDGMSAGLPPDMRILGAYDDRASVAGKKDGDYGFFKRADGSVFLCSWSAAAGIWADIGEVTDGPGAGGDGDAMMSGGGGSSSSFSSGAGAGASGSNWDCE